MASTMPECSAVQEGTRPATDKLEKRSQEGSMKNKTHLEEAEAAALDRQECRQSVG